MQTMQTKIWVYTVCYSIKYFKKQLHKEQNLCKKKKKKKKKNEIKHLKF